MISVLLALAVVLLAAKIGGDIMVRLRQPEVLGELIVGILLGNLALLGIDTFHFLREDLVLEILSELGVILLLFEVGLHTTIPDMLRVGGSALFRRSPGGHCSLLFGMGSRCLFPSAGRQSRSCLSGCHTDRDQCRDYRTGLD